jgi:hypothetical protein
MSIKANLQALGPAWDEFKRQQGLPASIPVTQGFSLALVRPNGVLLGAEEIESRVAQTESVAAIAANTIHSVFLAEALELTDIEPVEQVTQVVTEADVDGSLAGKFFDLTDEDGPVRVWLDVAERAQISLAQIVTVADLSGAYFDLEDASGPVRVWIKLESVAQLADVTVASVVGIGGNYFDLEDASGPVRVWIDLAGNSQAPATPTGGRLIEVDVLADDDDDAVAGKIEAAVDADDEFSASATDNVVTIANADAGARAVIAVSDEDIFTVAVDIEGRDATAAPATPADGRLIAVEIADDDNAAAVAALVEAAVDDDDEFSASSATDTVTITNADAGLRAAISTSDALLIDVSVDTLGVTAAGAPAIPDNGRLLQVDIIADDTAASIGGDIEIVVHGDAKFTAISNDGTLTITNAAAMALPEAVDGDTGFTITTETEGVTELDGTDLIATGMSVSLDAGTYAVGGSVIVEQEADDVDLKLHFAGILNGALNGATVDALTPLVLANQTGTVVHPVTGIITVSAPGAMVLSAAQNADASGDSTFLHVGTHLIFTKL